MINNDQTPSKYVPAGRFTMAPKVAKNVGVTGIADKRNITLTLTATLVALEWKIFFEKVSKIYSHKKNRNKYFLIQADNSIMCGYVLDLLIS